ncbi:aldehyde dehydrogenase (NADP(+)) [Mucilaginibacter glaciei]|uniref:Aldehyde dehydrogenase (NADP(+)) n=1 Tax=Mucilaginibacter glaciei TaxID=2772109 RepID=A0A926S701_9SPHI|nr:aldehyde dehydrogenase (NADP(+)) [Mucilaginibacter glaciei]MBD1394211.1 aldehyde dehydrogenase (NADP(+)) [Mucilaginibacter glaciei]
MTENTSTSFAISTAGQRTFSAVEAATGAALEGAFACATMEDIDLVMQLAAAAYPVYKSIGKEKKSAFLRAIAQEIEALGDALIERASAESGLPLARLQGERGRTCGQLRMFADLVDEGSWVEAVIDTALPERQPLPRPDLRKMLVALGPVVVFGASNFPLAFSVAGGDTASALAAGCPVVVKAHSAHPGTSALVADAIMKAAKATAMPDGVFAILFDDGFTVGEALVKHELTKAVTFTGSFKGGMALHEIAQQRKQPIPVFAEMGSINPVIFLPGILESQPEELAKQYAASITLGAGQFCTNPGLLLAIRSEGLNRFEDALAAAISTVASATMLTKGIQDNFSKLSDGMLKETGAELLVKGAQPANANQVTPVIVKTTAAEFLANPKFSHEVFGPYSLLVVADDLAQLEQIVAASEGQLTVTLMARETELAQYQPLIDKALAIAGRLILNNVPTGVEVCAAMQHGGPFPATSDSRFTSVGTSAIRRFVRPVSWQNWQQQLLPNELKDGNPLKIWRTVNQQFTKD